MEYLNRKWFEVVWSLKISPLKNILMKSKLRVRQRLKR